MKPFDIDDISENAKQLDQLIHALLILTDYHKDLPASFGSTLELLRDKSDYFGSAIAFYRHTQEEAAVIS